MATVTITVTKVIVHPKMKIHHADMNFFILLNAREDILKDISNIVNKTAGSHWVKKIKNK